MLRMLRMLNAYAYIYKKTPGQVAHALKGLSVSE